MAPWQRYTVVALALLACLAVAKLSPRLSARDAPAHTAQLPVEEPEPLAHVPVPPAVRPAEPPPPVVALHVRVPACATAGQELCYRICVENLSRAAAHHVLVRNPIPTGAKLVRTKPEAD